MEYELCHFGVKGMKWGVRKKDTSVANGNYTAKQRKRDRAFYGARGEKRINKRLNEGHGIQGARHYEVEKKDRALKRKATVKRGAKRAAKIIGSIGGAYLTDQVYNNGAGTRAVKNVIKNVGRTVVTAYTMARGGYDIRWFDK